MKTFQCHNQSHQTYYPWILFFMMVLFDHKGFSQNQAEASFKFKDTALNPVKISRVDELKEISVTQNGKPLVAIVHSKEKYYTQIAELLKKYLDQATGLKFQLRNEPLPNEQSIFIGNIDIATVREVFFKAQEMPAETLVVKRIPEGLVLAGNDSECKNRLEWKIPKTGLDINDRHQSRGTFFAMLDFLERFVGIRFYFPGIGIYVPDLSQEDFRIPSVTYTDTPLFSVRTIGYPTGKDFDLIKATPKEAYFWNNLLRLGDVNSKLAFHTDSKWENVYAKEHPEYFALREDGSRAIGDRGSFSCYRCYSTSNDGFKAHIRAIEKYYKTGEGSDVFSDSSNWEKAPNRRYIHWGPNDAFMGCYCPECKSLTDPSHGISARQSHIIWKYFIELAKECKKKWPDKTVITFAYGQFRKIPDFVSKENPGNMVIYPTSYGVNCTSAAYLKEPKVWDAANQYLDILRSVSCEKIPVWEHYPHMRSSPLLYPIPHYYQKFYVKNKEKIDGIIFNGDPRYSYALDSLMLYMMYKISWNPEFNVDACISEYCHDLFGPVGNDIYSYYQLAIHRWENTQWMDNPSDPQQMPYEVSKKNYWIDTYPRKIRDELEQTLFRAMSKTQKDTLYYDRAKLMVHGVAPFFQQGRLADLGKTFTLNCKKIKPKLDGTLDEWHPSGAKGVYLSRNETGERDPSMEGLIYAGYDEKNVYFAGLIKQEDGFLTKGNGNPVLKNQNIWAYDSLEIFLCTDQSENLVLGADPKGQFHQIIIDPDGSIWEGYHSYGSTKTDLDLKMECQINTFREATPPLFYFELSIPFEQLKCRIPKSDSQWLVNFYWNRPRKNKHQGYAWSGTGNYQDVSRFGTLHFIKE